jgi:hypothetical protein
MDKKWLIGCGGCLGLVLIVVIVGVGALWWGGSAFMEGSQKTAKSLFGETLPRNYMTIFGMPIDSQEGSVTMVVMINSENQKALFGIDAPLTADQRETMVSGDTQQLERLIQEAMASSNSNNVRSLQLKDAVPLKSPDGEVRALRFNVETDEGFMPMVVALLPMQADRMKMLLLMDPNRATTDPGVDFSAEFEEMAVHLEEIMAETQVSEGVVSFQRAG